MYLLDFNTIENYLINKVDYFPKRDFDLLTHQLTPNETDTIYDKVLQNCYHYKMKTT